MLYPDEVKTRKVLTAAALTYVAGVASAILRFLYPYDHRFQKGRFVMASTVNSRWLALEILLKITKDGEYSHLVLKETLDQYQYLDKKERAFITRIVNGTLERMIEIDYIINQFSKVKVNKMKPVIRTILRSGVYQLKYMDMFRRVQCVMKR